MATLPNPQASAVDKYLEKTKGHGQKTIQALANKFPFIQAMESELGQMILQDDIDRHEELLTKLYTELKLTVEEGAELTYLKSRLEKISRRIAEYTKGVKEVMDGK